MNVRDGYKLTEMGEIPVEWEPHKLQDISDFITKGATPTTYGFDWESEGILFLKSDCITSTGFSYGQSKFISEDAHLQMNRSIVKPGDILMSITGYIGKVIVLPNLFSEANINQHIARIRINSQNHSSKFIFYSLTMPQQTELLMKNSTGQAYPQISLVQVRNIVLYIPPLSEQLKIADILSTVDEHISETESLIEKTKVLKQGMMQRLLTKGIGHTEFKDTEIGRIPVEWELSYLTDLIIDGSSITYGVVKPGDEGEVRFIRSTDVKNGAINSSNLRTITKSVSDSYKRTVLRGGELLISLVGNPGQAAVVVPEFAGANIARQVALLRIDENKCNIFFAYYYLQSEAGQIELKDRIIGTAQQVINLKDLKTVLVAVPPLDEQQRITSMLTAIDDQIDSYQTKLTSLTKLKSALMQQLLTGKTRVKI